MALRRTVRTEIAVLAVDGDHGTIACLVEPIGRRPICTGHLQLRLKSNGRYRTRTGYDSLGKHCCYWRGRRRIRRSLLIRFFPRCSLGGSVVRMAKIASDGQGKCSGSYRGPQLVARKSESKHALPVFSEWHFSFRVWAPCVSRRAVDSRSGALELHNFSVGRILIENRSSRSEARLGCGRSYGPSQDRRMQCKSSTSSATATGHWCSGN